MYYVQWCDQYNEHQIYRNGFRVPNYPGFIYRSLAHDYCKQLNKSLQ